MWCICYITLLAPSILKIQNKETNKIELVLHINKVFNSDYGMQSPERWNPAIGPTMGPNQIKAIQMAHFPISPAHTATLFKPLPPRSLFSHSHSLTFLFF